MRRGLYSYLFWVFALGLSACDSSDSKTMRAPISDDAREPDEDEKPSRSDTAGRSGSNERGSDETATAPAKPPPRDTDTDTDAPDAGSSAVTCAGFAGLTCPGLGRCADDKGDDCDPDRGGADCAGVCICDAKAKCRDGQTWNADPAACLCEDPEEAEDGEEAEADAGADDPTDDAAITCGGIAALECPGASTCEDDPDDDCDPMSGGADCGGVCRCNVLGVCIAPAVWNQSPGVCACES